MDKEILEMYNQYDLHVSGDINGKTAWHIIEILEHDYPVDDIRLEDGTRLWNLLRIFIYTFHQEQTGKRNLDLISFLSDVSFKTIIHKALHRYCRVEGEDVLHDVINYIVGFTGVDKDRLTCGIYEYITVFKDMKEHYKDHLIESGDTEITLHGCGYGRLPMAMAQACRELGIKCIEEQHGVIDEYFPAYMRATPTTNHDCIPEYLETYDAEFTIMVQKGHLFDPDKVTTKGYPPIKRYILVSSQWILADEIKEFILKASELLDENYVFLFQPHTQDENNYDDLVSDAIVLIDKDEDVTDLFRVADLHTTVFSGRGYYAATYGVPTIYLDLKGLMQNRSCFIVQTPEEFVVSVVKLIKEKKK